LPSSDCASAARDQQEPVASDLRLHDRGYPTLLSRWEEKMTTSDLAGVAFQFAAGSLVPDNFIFLILRNQTLYVQAHLLIDR
jgi:hypothetical protein